MELMTKLSVFVVHVIRPCVLLLRLFRVMLGGLGIVFRVVVDVTGSRTRHYERERGGGSLR